MSVRSVAVDCDNDTLLLVSEPAGPTCHTGAHSCLVRPLPPRQQVTSLSSPS
ncbi:phosphoribosyl-AMP cyclohydrolase [Ornithinimicrobium sp. INDO-MA30-4]|uniref:phosphoribosyl-AMP cyclohydrolase n=1 Tax=Ornithinimicrobium sp. INDO-MA30-4 TaxID=2908651 RepID=UPI001F20E04A|nr:phosphoribosyl-AMP cyclohydrolase [Ornithinimicrobium sp. INDO-MA30-4]UJH71577.1 phosphoribosyl-AMP cyclohydrolase [Ornithinimicrobium sp. INDO-MA30-4]